MFVDFGNPGVGVVVFWSVCLVCVVYVWVNFQARYERVEVEDVEDFEFCHDGLVCAWWESFYDSDELFLYSDEWVYVLFCSVVGSPYRDVADQVWVSVGVV